MSKKVQLSFFLFFAAVGIAFSQTNVQLIIHHRLGDEAFTLNTAVTNNMDHEFDFTRLEYYLAEISLIHDGGQETLIEDTYVLVDGTLDFPADLGEHDITELEAIRFHVGVDEERNHADPSQYGSHHPLAPQFPSMHWGWAGGYRFVAIEGNSGENMGQVWQIHALGDVNYFQTEVPIQRTAVDGQLSIDLDADYTRALQDINLNSGPIIHGEYGDAVTTLENFQNHVFTASDLVSEVLEPSVVQDVKVFPNPVPASASPQVRIASNNLGATFQVQLTNVHGQVVRTLAAVGANETVELEPLQAGVYFVQVYKADQLVASNRLIVQ